jgi:hypothetical protein
VLADEGKMWMEKVVESEKLEPMDFLWPRYKMHAATFWTERADFIEPT